MSIEQKRDIIIQGDCLEILKTIPDESVDLVFADPPYDLPQLPQIPQMIFDANLLNPEGIFIMEHSANNNFAEMPQFFQHKHYGAVNFSFFQQA